MTTSSRTSRLVPRRAARQAGFTQADVDALEHELGGAMQAVEKVKRQICPIFLGLPELDPCRGRFAEILKNIKAQNGGKRDGSLNELD
jgi:hypothetical protein